MVVEEGGKRQEYQGCAGCCLLEVAASIAVQKGVHTCVAVGNGGVGEAAEGGRVRHST
jgi:hypothetical protein